MAVKGLEILSKTNKLTMRYYMLPDMVRAVEESKCVPYRRYR